MKFTHSSGSRPLDGYTIKRGIGQGGFGEVYYALSDSGKEVALKLVRDNLEVELRGMAQCLNFKHPHLVALYDIKRDGHGDSWVVMEYVAGDNLSAILNRHPNGLACDLATQWFLALAKAVGYLHDNGIVHRDLKPGNVFIEHGLVKVGDYGLSKFISGSQRSAQTQSVGTVHYMAPEISTGNYGKGIDIYAAGVILYEMLTGRVPFDGESTGEILMKHLTATPDLEKLPQEFREIVGTALAKNPAHRYGSFAEMALAVEQTGQTAPAAAPQPLVEPVRRLQPEPSTVAAPPVISLAHQGMELCGSIILSALVALLFALIWGAIDRTHAPAEFGATLYLTVLGSWAVLIPSKFWGDRAGDGDPWLRRGLLLILGLGLGLAAAWLNGWSFAPEENVDLSTAILPVELPTPPPATTQLFGYMSYFGVAFFLLRWWKLTERRRSRRFSFFPVVLYGGVGFVLYYLLWPDRGTSSRSPLETQGPVVLVMTAAILQLVSPWTESRPLAARRRLRYRAA